jgi:hypothetical protein
MMLAQIPMDFATMTAGPYGSAALLGMLIWGVANCFFGYPLFRVVLMVHGALFGRALGLALAMWLRGDAAASLDFWVAGVALAILGGLAAWLACRAVFAGALFWLVACAIARSMGLTAGGWVLGSLVGVIAAGVGFYFLRWTIITLTVLGGAAMVALAGAMTFTGATGWEPLVERTFGPEGKYMLGFAVIVVGAILAAVGFAVQHNLADAMSDVFMPRNRKRRKVYRPQGTTTNPPFTKL